MGQILVRNLDDNGSEQSRVRARLRGVSPEQMAPQVPADAARRRGRPPWPAETGWRHARLDARIRVAPAGVLGRS